MCDVTGMSCRRVVFSFDRNRAWKVMDHLDEEHQWGTTVRAESGFLIVNGRDRCGTGCYLNFDDWYEIYQGKLRRVLVALKNGHEVDANPARGFNGTVLGVELYAYPDREEIAFAYLVRFSDHRLKVDLGSEHRLAYYVRKKGEAEFKLDPARSEITQTEIESIFRYDTKVDPTQLVSFARESFRRLARSGTPAQKQWLRQFLSSVPSSPAKSKLLSQLDRIPR